STPYGTYFLLRDKGGSGDGAIAFVSNHLVIAGTETSVAHALEARNTRGSSFAAGAGLGRHLSRVDSGATAWALVDMSRFPLRQREGHGVHVKGTVNNQPVNVDVTEHGNEPSIALLSAMKSVSLVAIQATVKGDSVS